MPGFLSNELSILGVYGLMVIALLLAQVLLVMRNAGIAYVASARDRPVPITGVAGRMVRTVDNSIAGMALFGPAAVGVAALGATTPATLLAAQVFLLARIVFVPVYLSGISYVRGPVWMTGLFATGFLYLQLLT